MRLFLSAAATVALATGSATVATANPGKGTKPHAAVPQAHTPAGQMNHSNDRDMGDENVSPTAIETVCTKDNPAADRSAICDDEDGPPMTRG